MNAGWDIIEKYQYAEYMKKHRHNLTTRVWVLALATGTVIALVMSALVQ